MSTRDYDVVLYGASGFTGRQTVQYFAQHTHADAVRWAIAGRSRPALEAAKARAGADVDVLIADSRDQTAVDAVVARTRVLLNTAGPFALYANAVVDACVRHRTHYCDITGETPWVKDLMARYHETAAATGTRIIPFCGFDSVPSDLGAYLMVHHIQQTWGLPCRAVKAYFQMYGGFNGGTLASMYNLYESGRFEELHQPFLLNPPEASLTEKSAHHQDPTQACYDADIGTWVAPFIMGPINTRVVRRSAALYEQWQRPYGPDFAYQEYAKCVPPLARSKAVGVTAALAFLNVALRRALPRDMLQAILPKPGTGPSEQTMNRGWFRCELLGRTDHGHLVRGSIRDHGDPGNRVTVKCLCEAALSLALRPDELPGGAARGGILTPATGLGDVLASRLRQAGMVIEIGNEGDVSTRGSRSPEITGGTLHR